MWCSVSCTGSVRSPLGAARRRSIITHTHLIRLRSSCSCIIISQICQICQICQRICSIASFARICFCFFGVFSFFVTAFATGFGAGVAGSAMASAYAITVNGEPYSSELSWSGGGWCDWKAWYWGAIKLKKGENVIVIRINEGCQINIDYFRIESMSKIDFVKE